MAAKVSVSFSLKFARGISVVMKVLIHLRLTQIDLALPDNRAVVGAGCFRLLRGAICLSILGMAGPAVALQPGLNPASGSPALLISQLPAASVVQLGDSGELVTELQNRLTERGYYTGPITGYYGTLTEEAVIQFQQDNGLIVDGTAGPETIAALRPSTLGTGGPASDLGEGILQPGTVGTAVTDLQIRLRDLGYYTGPIDGGYGQMTENAVIRFQRSQGLTADGVLGPATLAALDNPVAATLPTSGPTVNPPTSALPVSPTPSSTGQPTVLELQRRLQQQGFYAGPLDGLMGPATQAAIEAAQRAYQLNPDDIVR